MKAPVSEAREGGDFKIVSQGVHIAVYETFAYLGEQPKSWAGESWMAPECWLRWAVMDEFNDEGVPLAIHAFPYTFNMGVKANLRKVIEASFGKPFPSDQAAGEFDFKKLLGCTCQISVTHTQHKTKTKEDGSPMVYAHINSWMPLPKTQTLADGQVIEIPRPDISKVELIYYDEENQTQFDKLPQWIRKKINTAGSPGRPDYKPVQSGDYTGRDFTSQPPNEDKAGNIPDYDDSDIPF